MNIWLAEMSQIVHRLLGAPAAWHQQVLILCIAILTIFMSFHFAVGVAGISHFGGFGVLMALGVGLLTLLGSAAAVAAFVLPHCAHSPWASWLLMLLPIVIVFVVGVPLQCAILRSGYIPMVMAFGSAVVTTMLILMATQAVMGSFSAGKAESDLLRARKSAAENFEYQ